MSIRKKRLDVPALHDESSNSSYAFFRGWNPAAIISMFAEFITYSLLLHPLTYEFSSIFAYTTASLPTIFVGGLLYFITTKRLIIPKGNDGYSKEEIKRLKELSKSL